MTKIIENRYGKTMKGDAGNKEKNGSSKDKEIRVNSIKDPLTKRILKPCEARAGHGAIMMIVALSIFAGLAALIFKGMQWVYHWITGP